jgi:DNA-binding winged helix-turn-helix (wHTH) protein
MQDIQPSSQTVSFGAFEIDFTSRELRKHGIKIRLQEQPLQILELLLEHAGAIVSREDIQKRIWPANTFVDFDKGLYNAVKKLREALGDTAATPRFIETIPRRGYRFIGPVILPVRFATNAGSELRSTQGNMPRWLERNGWAAILFCGITIAWAATRNGRQ